MENFCRTDLGCEKSPYENINYSVYKKDIENIPCIFSVSKLNGKVENVLMYTGKPYMYSSSYSYSVSQALSQCMSTLLSSHFLNPDRILICGLGNRNITSDSLGSAVTDILYPTVRLNEFKKSIYVIAPGVEGQSGFSTLDFITSAIQLSNCDLIIAIDSLCARNSERLATTIQLSSLGILPGSGVGNHKKEISYKTTGIPVISIGVPTVSEIGAIAKGMKMNGYYVSPNDVDLCIGSFADIIAESIEKTFYNSSKET